MKDAISKLTASKDLIGAVRCGMRDEVIAILDKDVRFSFFNFCKAKLYFKFVFHDDLLATTI